MPSDLSALSDAGVAALLFGVDPHGFGGLLVRGHAGPVRDRYLAEIRDLFPSGTPWRRLPVGMAEERLEGGLDLAATLAFGRPVMEAGLLAESDGGVLVVPMAERLPMAVAARLGMALDTGKSTRGPQPAHFGLIALDESLEGETVAASLADRLAFRVDLTAGGPDAGWRAAAEWLARARRLAASVGLSEATCRAVAATAADLGVDSSRPALATLRAARVLAALAGRSEVTPDDAGMAARLILAPRAIRAPAAREPSRSEPAGSAEDKTRGADDPSGREQIGGDVDESVREAVKAALPPGLLLGLESDGRTARQIPGRAGAPQAGKDRGRPAGLRRGMPRGGARLNVIETLRAAAPWQALRRPADIPPNSGRRIQIRRDDLRLTRFKQRSETVTLFAVDASGSLALQRLNEAKGAVELLLAECYVRRDQVALLAFRGTGAELLLPPTRSLARAKRSLADLAGGGPTPLATALDAATALADGIRRRGRTPTLVLFTDGRANVTRDGVVDRVRAQAEAEDAARASAGTGLRALLIDAAPRPQAAARALARNLNATYLPLPRADAAGLTWAIRQATD